MDVVHFLCFMLLFVSTIGKKYIIRTSKTAQFRLLGEPVQTSINVSIANILVLRNKRYPAFVSVDRLMFVMLGNNPSQCQCDSEIFLHYSLNEHHYCALSLLFFVRYLLDYIVFVLHPATFYIYPAKLYLLSSQLNCVRYLSC